MRISYTKFKHNNTIYFNVREKGGKKYITITIVILVEPYVASIFLPSNHIGDVHEARDHGFVQLYEDMLHSMDDGLVAQRAVGYYLPHPHTQM